MVTLTIFVIESIGTNAARMVLNSELDVISRSLVRPMKAMRFVAATEIVQICVVEIFKRG